MIVSVLLVFIVRCQKVSVMSFTRHICSLLGRGIYQQHGRYAAPCLLSPVRSFLDVRDKDHHEKEKQLVIHQSEYFDEAAKRARDKHTYKEALTLYLKRNEVYRKGHVEFLYAALSRMKEFNVNRDIETYKQLLTLFPERKMVAESFWQVEFMHYPKQQQCCIDILDHMEENGET